MKIRLIILSCFFVFFFDVGNLSPLPSELKEEHKPALHHSRPATQSNIPHQKDGNKHCGIAPSLEGSKPHCGERPATEDSHPFSMQVDNKEIEKKLNTQESNPLNQMSETKCTVGCSNNNNREQKNNCESGNCHNNRRHELSEQNDSRSACETSSIKRETRTRRVTCEGGTNRRQEQSVSKKSRRLESGECRTCTQKKEIRSQHESCESGKCQTVRRQESSDSGSESVGDGKCVTCSKNIETKLQQEYTDSSCTECSIKKTDKRTVTEYSQVTQKQDGQDEPQKQLKEFNCDGNCPQGKEGPPSESRKRDNQRKLRQCNGECSRKRSRQESPCVGNCPMRKKEQKSQSEVENIHKVEEKLTCGSNCHKVKEEHHCSGENSHRCKEGHHDCNIKSHKNEEGHTCSNCHKDKKESHCVGNCPKQTEHLQTCTGNQCAKTRQKCEGGMCRNEERLKDLPKLSDNTGKQNHSHVSQKPPIKLNNVPSGQNCESGTCQETLKTDLPCTNCQKQINTGVRPPTKPKTVPSRQNCESGNCQTIVKKDLSCTDCQKQTNTDNGTIEQTFSNFDSIESENDTYSETNEETTSITGKDPIENQNSTTEISKKSCDGNCTKIEQTEERRIETQITKFTQQICKGNCSDINQAVAVKPNNTTLEKTYKTKDDSTKTDLSTQTKSSDQSCTGNCTSQDTEIENIEETCTDCQKNLPTEEESVCVNCDNIEKLMTVVGEDSDQAEESPPEHTIHEEAPNNEKIEYDN